MISTFDFDIRLPSYYFEEFNQISTTRFVLLLCKILCHYKSLTPPKSMFQKNNYNLTDKYPYVPEGTLKPMRIKDVLTMNSCLLPNASI